MSESEGRKRKKKGIRFKNPLAKSQTRGPAASLNGAENYSEQASTKSKKRFGARIKRIVKGRRKGRKEDAENSVYSTTSDYDPQNPPIESLMASGGPRTALDPGVLAAVVEEESFHSDSDRVDGRQKRRELAKEQRERGGSTSRIRTSDNGGIREDPESRYYDEETDDDLPPEEAGSGPISLVLLLVDPKTLRFELLQLEFEHPEESKIGEVLEQVHLSVTEPALKGLSYTALVDRKGGTHESDKPLMDALKFQQRRKDILVGLAKSMTAEQTSKLARPILGDKKVIMMLERNGYKPEGWTKKARESALLDAKDKSFRQNGSNKWQIVAAVIALLVVVFLLPGIYRAFLGGKKIAEIEESAESAGIMGMSLPSILAPFVSGDGDDAQVA